MFCLRLRHNYEEMQHCQTTNRRENVNKQLCEKYKNAAINNRRSLMKFILVSLNYQTGFWPAMMEISVNFRLFFPSEEKAKLTQI